MGETKRGSDRRLEHRRPDRERTSLQLVDEDPDVAGQRCEGRPQADQQDGEAETLPHLVRAQPERNHRDEVSNGDGDRGCDDAEVAVPDGHPSVNLRLRLARGKDHRGHLFLRRVDVAEDHVEERDHDCRERDGEEHRPAAEEDPDRRHGDEDEQG
jgi:hypothetical protein